jgi:hypothetical protein
VLGRRKWLAFGLMAGVAGTLIAFAIIRVGLIGSLTGVVLTANPDPAKQVPIAGVRISASGRSGQAVSHSDASGFFRINLPRELWRGESVKLALRHEGYNPLLETQPAFHQVYVMRLTPLAATSAVAGNQPEVMLSDVRVRYMSKGATTTEIGSTVRTFQVVNQGNIACDGHAPCSPDGRWRASMGGIKLDAGDGQEFRNARVSCIAGPCPFTRMENDGFSGGGRTITVAVRDWSDTTTFLVEAEVVRTAASDVIRQAYPAIFGRVISFTLPPNAQGPSFEVEWNGQEITFPLGPDLLLSWANCTLKGQPDQTKLYSCVLKPGYQVRS